MYCMAIRFASLRRSLISGVTRDYYHSVYLCGGHLGQLVDSKEEYVSAPALQDCVCMAVAAASEGSKQVVSTASVIMCMYLYEDSGLPADS